ncbi:MAG: hypothetical protein ACU0C9_02980 [Paracoccaceae bacterium]
MKHAIRCFLSFVLFLALVGVATAEVYFVGQPKTKLSGSVDTGTLLKLTTQQSLEFTVVISLIDGEYYWSTREDKKLIRHQSGMFEIFVAEDGSGMIKFAALDQNTRRSEGKPEYFEMIHFFLGTVTYFGDGSLAK